MQIEPVYQNTEHALLSRLQQSATGSALHIQSSRKGIPPDQQSIIFIVREVLDDRNATIYFFADGDLVIVWHGAQKTVVSNLRQRVCDALGVAPDPLLDRYYDINVQGEELHQLCQQKLRTMEARNASLAQSHSLSLPSASQIAQFREIARLRTTRKSLEVVIVEDQPFSVKLLAGLLNRIAKVHTALNAKDGMSLYLHQAPDIIFLDIEMPDSNGHELAARIKQLDADAYIVMVTANHYSEDVSRAKLNGARGFVVKPYSKQKILENVEHYIHERKLKS